MINLIQKNRPKIGLAFSGGTLRAISQVGILEVFDEHHIPVDFIAAASSGCIAAASYACGTMEKLKDVWFNLTREKLYALIGREGASGGIYQLRKMEILFREFTLNKHFEDVHPRLGFVAVDIVAGEEVVLQMGDIARAIRVSCSVPGIFEPVRWGNRLLVDGGLLLDTVPVNVAHDMGADIIVGVDIADSKYVFGNYGWLIYFWKKYFALRQTVPMRMLNKFNESVRQTVRDRFQGEGPELDIAEEKKHSWFSILSRSLDVMIEKKYQTHVNEAQGQILIAPQIKHFRSYDPKIVSIFYDEGRKAALAAIPRIQNLLESYDPEK